MGPRREIGNNLTQLEPHLLPHPVPSSLSYWVLVLGISICPFFSLLSLTLWFCLIPSSVFIPLLVSVTWNLSRLFLNVSNVSFAPQTLLYP